jgi:hypothetical protein
LIPNCLDKKRSTVDLQIILTVVQPPPGVLFAVQRERDELLPPYASTAESLSFALTVKLGLARADGSFNFLGPYAQGTPDDRYVYVNSGVRAGQTDTPWERRAKIKLGGIPRELVEAAAGVPHRAVQAHIQGTMRDGGPVCASVPPSAISWQLVKGGPQG